MTKVLLTCLSLVFLASSCSLDQTVVQTQYQTTQVIVGGHTVLAEIADTAPKRQIGLSQKSALAENHGMLFVFDTEDKHSIWMKDMKFPIDIIWIRNGLVVETVINAMPQPGAPEQELVIYTPKHPSDQILEVTAGFVAKTGIKVGDQVLVKN